MASYFAFEGLKAHVRRLMKRHELELRRSGVLLTQGGVIVIAVVRNETPRLSHWLDYYRGLGVDHFFIVDNLSDDGLELELSHAADVTVYRADGQYGRARYGVDWVNIVLSRHALGRWVLHVDADEYLVFPDVEHRSLASLCREAERAGVRAVNAMLVDMYSRLPAAANAISAGQDPLEVTAMFDASGYDHQFDHRSGVTWIKGGVRGRLFFADDVSRGPALNKTPLVRWRWHYNFVKSTHELWPRGLNRAHRPAHAALLHFKFTALAASKIVDQEHRRQQTTEYDAYDRVSQVLMVGPDTRIYTRPADLVGAGLLADWQLLDPPITDAG